MKKLTWLILAGSPSPEGKPWVPYAEYPEGARLVAVTRLKGDTHPTEYGGLFECHTEATQTVKRSFRVLNITVGDAVDLPDEAEFLFEVPQEGGGFFSLFSTSRQIVYEVPWDCQALTPEDLAKMKRENLDAWIERVKQAKMEGGSESCSV